MGANNEGFAGSVAAMSVADVLQFQRASQFSGSIVFSHEGRQATVFFQAGEVIHAEEGAARGEEAIRAILSWPSGNFQAHPNVSTFSRTIHKGLEHLLLESLRRIDEARTGSMPLAPTPAPSPRPPADAPPRRSPPSAALKARAVAGATYAVVLRGRQLVGDASPQAEALAARSVYLLAMISAPLGKALGLGELASAALSSQQGEQLLLFHSQEAHLAVSVTAGEPLYETEAAIRRALSTRASG